jgi:hypothetical protein
MGGPDTDMQDCRQDWIERARLRGLVEMSGICPLIYEMMGNQKSGDKIDLGIHVCEESETVRRLQ